MNGREKTASALALVFRVVFLVIFGSLAFAMVFANRGIYTVGVWRQLLSALVYLAALLGIGLLAATRRLRGWVLSHDLLFLFAGMLLLVAAQIYVTSHITTVFGWDVGAVVNAAMETEGEASIESANWYFNRFPNNMLLFFLFRIIGQLAGRFEATDGIWRVLAFINVAFIDVGIVLCLDLARRVYGRAAALCTLLLSMALFSILPWMVTPYSDTMALPFVIGAVYGYARLRQAKRGWGKALAALWIGLCGGIGILIKPMTAVVLVAIVLGHLLALLVRPREEGLRALWMLGAAAVCAACLLGFDAFAVRQQVFDYTPGVSYPPTHFISMGLSRNGAMVGSYDYDDVLFTEEFKTTAEKDAANRRRIQEKLQARGVAAQAMFVMDKARWITSEGYFCWGGEGGFAETWRRQESVPTRLFYPEGDLFPYYLYAAQGIWIVIMALMTLTALRHGRDERALFTLILQLAIFGLLLFILIFEARSRYLISYLPCFVLLAGLSLGSGVRWIRGAFRGRKAASPTGPA